MDAGHTSTPQSFYDSSNPEFRCKQWIVFALTFLSYSSYHACRQSFANAKTLLSDSWHFSKHFEGAMDAVFLFCYAFGLFMSGVLGDRFDAAKVHSFGLAMTAFVLILFASSRPYLGLDYNAWYLMLWAINGFVQSLGWPTGVKLIANWFDGVNAGFIFALWAANQSMGNIVGAAYVSLVTYLNMDVQLIFYLSALQSLFFAFLVFIFVDTKPSLKFSRARKLYLEQQSIQRWQSNQIENDNDSPSNCPYKINPNGDQESTEVIMNSINSQSGAVSDIPYNDKNGCIVNDSDLSKPLLVVISSPLILPSYMSPHHRNPYCSQKRKSEKTKNKRKENELKSNAIENNSPEEIEQQINRSQSISPSIISNYYKENISSIQAFAIPEHYEYEFDLESDDSQTALEDRLSFKQALNIPNIIRYGVCYACLKGVNYSILFWLAYFEYNQFGDEKSDFLSVIYNIAQIIGGLLCGYVSDHFMRRRSPVIFVFLLIAIPPIYLLYIPSHSMLLISSLCFLSGFFVGGPMNILSTVMAADLGKLEILRGRPASLSTVSGIIDGIGSLGAAVVEYSVTWMSDYGLELVYAMLSVLIFLSAMLLMPVCCRDVYFLIVEKLFRNGKIDIKEKYCETNNCNSSNVTNSV